MFYEAPRHSEPGIHALVIGVGHYPYLTRTTRSGTATRPVGPLAAELTSPPLSALAFAKWLSHTALRNWTVPLATVDLLLSVAPGQLPLDVPASAHGEATIDAIREAFSAWLARSAENPDNVAIFYFCGHGVQSDGQFLLASDFNRHAETPFAHAFNFDTTRLALLQKGPRTQWTIVDACRADWTRRQPSGVPPLAATDVFATRACQNEMTLRMPLSDLAGARTGEVSFLTQALLRALNGQAATTDEQGRWVVSMDGVRRSIEALLHDELEAGTLSRSVERISLGDAVLHRLDGPPLTRLVVRCLPPEATVRTTVRCTPHDTAPPDDAATPATARLHKVNGGHSQEWRIDLRAGVYTVRADCDQRPVSRTQSVMPPQTVMSLRVSDA